MAKFSIRQNAAGEWFGYESGRKLATFLVPAEQTRAAAEGWLREVNVEEARQRWGGTLARLAQGHSRTALSVDTQDVGLAGALVKLAEDKQLPVLAVAIEKGRARRQAWVRVTVKAAEWDIEVSGIGDSVLLFRGHSADGIDWLHEHVAAEPWQCLGPNIGVEHRYAGAIISGAADAGLRVRVL
jgi:hypothetical protein